MRPVDALFAPRFLAIPTSVLEKDTPMEALGACAQNIATYYASGVAVLACIIAIGVFCLNRRFILLAYGMVSAGFAYVTAYLILPHLVFWFVVGTFGIGAAACDGFW